MNNISDIRPLLRDMPPDCLGTIVDQLAGVSDRRQPLFRSLLRWSQTSKEMQKQLSYWTDQHARPADHIPSAFHDAFYAETTLPEILGRAERCAIHLTPQLIFDIGFLDAGSGDMVWNGEHVALTLMALAHVNDRLEAGTVATFLQRWEEGWLNKERGRPITSAEIDGLALLASSIFKVAGLLPSRYAPKNPALENCLETLLMLPQSMKSVALHFALADKKISKNEKFERLLVASIHQLVPKKWDKGFMGSLFGKATLDACDIALSRFGARSKKFLNSCSRLFGTFIAGLPARQRDFRTLSCTLPVLNGLFWSGDESESVRQGYESDDSIDGLTPAQISTKEMLERIFNLLQKGHASESCKNAFIRDFVNNGFMTEHEFARLIKEFSEGNLYVSSFSQFAAMLDDEKAVNRKPVKESKRKCVIS